MANDLRCIAISLLLALTGCQQQTVREFGAGRIVPGDMPVKKYDTPPQVIYRIDDHRFVTLENYKHCAGDAWYWDTKTGVRTKVGDMWVNGFRGRLIIDDPTGMNVALPTISTNLCGDRGCMDYVAYSTDGGKNFGWVQYDEDSISFNPVESSHNYTFLVTRERLYVSRKWGDDAFVFYFPLISGIDLGSPYPDGAEGGSLALSSKPTLITAHRTPSGQDHYICDNSIQPSNPD